LSSLTGRGLCLAVWHGCLLLFCAPAFAQPAVADDESAARLSAVFAQEVDHRLEVPLADQQRAVALLGVVVLFVQIGAL
jgi:hypothetical protein